MAITCHIPFLVENFVFQSFYVAYRLLESVENTLLPEIPVHPLWEKLNILMDKEELWRNSYTQASARYSKSPRFFE